MSEAQLSIGDVGIMVGNPLLAESLASVLRDGGMASCVLAGRGQDLTASIGERLPPLILVDFESVQIEPESFIDALARRPGDTDCVGYLPDEDTKSARLCIDSGFAGVVARSSGAHRLMQALQVVATGGIYLDPGFSQLALGATRREKAAPLSPRERDVLENVARGLCMKQIAAKMGLSVKSVEASKAAAARRLDLPDRSAIVSFAMRENWL